jgi:phage regulator Rha-like protein/phage antirepressor YoqD-like protein
LTFCCCGHKCFSRQAEKRIAQKLEPDMNLITASATQTMSSREIAELVQSRHDKVKQSIERLAERGAIAQPPMGDEQETDAMGRVRVTKVYRICKRDSYVIVAQLSPEFTARLVDRWQELEAAQQIDPRKALSDPAALRSLLLDNVEKVLALEAIVSELRPASHALERIATSEGSMCITDAAKALQIRPKALFDYLRQNSWIYRRAGSVCDVAYQARLQTGVMEHKVTVVSRDDGTEKTTTQARITPKGLTQLAKVFDVVDATALALLEL